MPEVSAISNALHTLSSVIWVGGMFFAYQVLRPAAGPLDAPVRLDLWNRVLPKFFIWVWHAVVLLPLTGFWAVFVDFGGFAGAPLYIHIMTGLGLIMIAIYLYLVFKPYPAFRRAADASAWPEAGTHLAAVRRLVGINLVLGLITVAVGSSGRFWF